MSALALWYRKRLRVLARGPRSYGAFDTVNAALMRQGLIAQTSRIVGPSRREYEITDGGRTVLRDACDGEARAVPERLRPRDRSTWSDATSQARV